MATPWTRSTSSGIRRHSWTSSAWDRSKPPKTKRAGIMPALFTILFRYSRTLE
jgi:hypothetical protein